MPPGLPQHAGLPERLSLGVLRTLARFAQTDLFALDLSRVARYETCAAQRRAQGFVVLHQGACNTVPNCTGLTEATAASDSYIDVEFVI